jgi:hypothetical protein
MKKRAFYKILTVLMAIVALFMPSMILAQDVGQPCDGADAYGSCPLDTWVMVLAFAAVVFAVLHLNRKQKRTFIAK